VLADERGEHLHHGRVVSGRVAGDTLQGVDAADPHVEPLVRAELLDRLGVAVSDLPLLGQFEGAPRHGEVPRGEDQGSGGKQARAERHQPAPRVIYRCLVQRPPGRADVVVGEPIRYRNEQRPHNCQRQDDDSDPYQPLDAWRQGCPAFQHRETLEVLALARRIHQAPGGPS
jgi:hypothetical protein